MTGPSPAELRARVEEALGTVPDPCMDLAGTPASIVELGLVRGVRVHDGEVEVVITFTEPGCAYTHAVLDMVHSRVEALPGVRSVTTTLSWAPTWSPEDLLAPARQALAAARSRLGGGAPAR
ncbi:MULTISPECIES: metal-sulfur cluster assembly factor [unclassified Geodermatophilus]